MLVVGRGVRRGCALSCLFARRKLFFLVDSELQCTVFEMEFVRSVTAALE